MVDEPTAEDLADARALLHGLSVDVARKTDVLAPGNAKRLTQEALDEATSTDVAFGNPSDKLVRLTPQLYKAIGLSPDPIQRLQLDSGVAFYHLALPVTIFTSEKPKFSELGCHVNLGLKDGSGPTIHALLPSPAWRERAGHRAVAE